MASDINTISQAEHTAEELLAGDSAILDQLILMFQQGLNLPVVYWQIACIVASILGSWIVTAILLRWIRNKHLIEAVNKAVDEKLPDIAPLSKEEEDNRKNYPFLKLFMQMSWACFAMLFLALSAFACRALGLLPDHHLPLESIAWLICEAYVIVRLTVFALHRTIKGLNFSKGVDNALVFSIWTMVALQIVGILPKFVEFLKTTSIPIGKESVSIWSIGMAVFTITLALFIAKWLGQIAERWIWSLPKVQSNLRVVLIRLLKIVLAFIAILVGLSSVGIDITILGVFGGAIGVGLGFGLQKIASNYVSGFIILLDRSIKIGDMVKVAGIEGIVQDIKTRYTVIRQYNGSVTIIPNESFVVSNVVNTSYLQGPGRATVTISVDYSSDVDAVIELMNSIVRAQPRVMSNPAPFTRLTNFGDDGIDLTAYFWVPDPGKGTSTLRSDISRAFLREFDKAGINIPYAQRELRVLSMPDIVCKVETGADKDKNNSD